MSRLIWAVTGILLIVSAVGVLLLSIRLITQESPQQAYERGKVDGQLLVFRFWGDYDEETINVFIDCIHLLKLSKFGTQLLYDRDSFDTFYVMTVLYDKDSLLLDVSGQRVIIDQLDSTDTMPGVERD